MSRSEPDDATTMQERAAARPGTPENDSLAALRRLPFFEGASEAAVARLAARAQLRSCAAGGVVVDTGDATDDVYFILSGAVRVVVRTVFGYEAILNDLGPGSFFGELAAIDKHPRSANVTALLHTQLYVVPGEAFIELVLSSPDLGRRLLRMLARRLRTKDDRLIEFSVLTVRQRLIAELLRLSRDRGNGQRVLSPPPPHHVLAARIGTRRESISRELKDMARTGLVTVGRRAIVLDRHDLLMAEIQARLHGPQSAVSPSPG